ncbi:MAG: hypothetical protein GXO04_04045 [Aquificae bacterium]|nr:hypothetical protein [Aquificota bacterium]
MRKLLAVLGAGIALANPWGREEGELFLSTQFYYYEATNYWDNDGNKKPIGCTFKKRELALYGEFGLSSRTTIFGKIPYQDLECGSSSTSGVSDLELGLQRKLYQRGAGVASLKLTGIIPTGYSINDDLRLGYGRVGAEAMLLGGYGFSKGWTEGGAGFRYYAGYPSEQLRGYWRIGLKPVNWVILMNTLEIHYGLGNGTVKRIGKNVTVEPDYKLLQNDLTVALRLGRLWIQIGYLDALWGRMTGDGSSVYSQVWFFF